MRTAFDLDAHLDGLMNLPPQQRTILDHALWELTELPD
jgi:hypothetical protein